MNEIRKVKLVERNEENENGILIQLESGKMLMLYWWGEWVEFDDGWPALFQEDNPNG